MAQFLTTASFHLQTVDIALLALQQFCVFCFFSSDLSVTLLIIMKVFACVLIACLVVSVYSQAAAPAAGNAAAAGQAAMLQAAMAGQRGGAGGLGSIMPLAAMSNDVVLSSL